MFVVSSWLFNGDGHMFDGWWMMFPIVFMVLVILMLFGFWRRGSGPWMGPMDMGGHSGGGIEGKGSAVEILRRRYAAGELTDDQFEAMRRKLEA